MRNRKNTLSKYQKLKETHNIRGFIVNIHGATNFDIDLEIPDELRDQYRSVTSNKYLYQDLDENFPRDPNLSQLSEIPPKTGTAYRCRLRGVGLNENCPNKSTWKNNQISNQMKQLSDRTDGWVTCTLSDIDIYQRLLVDIYLDTSRGPINFCDFLLLKMSEEENPIYCQYNARRNS